MAMKSGFFSLSLLVLALCLISTLGVLVDVENELPSESKEPLKLVCEQPSVELRAGDHYNRTVNANEGSLQCTAMWLPFFNTWDAYKANLDKGHSHIFWSVRKDGFYRSYDIYKWNKIMDWVSE